MIKLRIFNDDFQEILKYLQCGGMMNHCIISFKQNKIFSIQRQEYTSAIRYFSYAHKCVMNGNRVESVKVYIPPILKRVKRISKSTVLSIETDGTCFVINYGKGEMYFDCEAVETIFTTLPFEIKDDMPIVSKDKIPLDTKFTILNSDLMEAVKCSYIHNTECFGFILQGGKLSLHVGGFHKRGGTEKLHPEIYYFEGNNVKVTLHYGIREIAKTFGQYIQVNMRTDAPAWFTEKTDDHVLGVFIPPREKEKY